MRSLAPSDNPPLPRQIVVSGCHPRWRSTGDWAPPYRGFFQRQFPKPAGTGSELSARVRSDAAHGLGPIRTPISSGSNRAPMSQIILVQPLVLDHLAIREHRWQCA